MIFYDAEKYEKAHDRADSGLIKASTCRWRVAVNLEATPDYEAGSSARGLREEAPTSIQRDMCQKITIALLATQMAGILLWKLSEDFHRLPFGDR